MRDTTHFKDINRTIIFFIMHYIAMIFNIQSVAAHLYPRLPIMALYLALDVLLGPTAFSLAGRDTVCQGKLYGHVRLLEMVGLIGLGPIRTVQVSKQSDTKPTISTNYLLKIKLTEITLLMKTNRDLIICVNFHIPESNLLTNQTIPLPFILFCFVLIWFGGGGGGGGGGGRLCNF